MLLVQFSWWAVVFWAKILFVKGEGKRVTCILWALDRKEHNQPFALTRSALSALMFVFWQLSIPEFQKTDKLMFQVDGELEGGFLFGDRILSPSDK